MSAQLSLCTRIVRTGCLKQVLSWGITSEDFTHNIALHIWTVLLAHYQNQATSGAILNEAFIVGMIQQPLYDFLPHDPVDAICAHVRRERIAIKTNALVVEASEQISIPNADPGPILTSLSQGVQDLIALGSTRSTDLSFRGGMEAIQRRFAMAQLGQNTARLLWPWAEFNDQTFGIQPDDYIVFYGRPKSMKTWVLVYLMAHAIEHCKKIIVYTKEMTPENVYMRVLACMFHLPYQTVREATAPLGVSQVEATKKMEDWRALDRFLNSLLSNMLQDSWLSEIITVLDAGDAQDGDTVGWLESKIDHYKPDLCFVDGLYLMADQRKHSSDHQRMMHISRDMRQLNRRTLVPLICTMQANRKAAAHNQANLDEIAYSDALSQDCTIASRVIADKTSPTISLVLAGSREFKLHGMRIHGVPASNFGFHSILSEKDIEKAKEADTVEAEQEDKASKEKKQAKKGAANRQGVSTPVEMQQTEAATVRVVGVTPETAVA